VLHTVVDEPPTGDSGAVVPVELTPIGAAMVPNAVDDIIAVDEDIVVMLPDIDVETVLCTVDDVGTGDTVKAGDGRGGTASGCGAGMVKPGRSVINDVAACADSVRNGAVALPVADAEEFGDAAVVGVAETEGIALAVPTIADMETTDTGEVPGAICAVGVEQVTTVPAVAGSEASGTGASVTSGVPGRVVAENGLGPLSGDVTIVPGVDGIPMAVVPMVETCAMHVPPPSSNPMIAERQVRIENRSCVRFEGCTPER
jgi:hypothetical protein